MHIAIVVQRFGTDIIGGAEAYALKVCEKLIIEKNWKIDVYTTNAKDYLTWKPEVFEKEVFHKNLKVFRFAAKFKKSKILFSLYKRFYLICQKYIFFSENKLNRFVLSYLEKLWILIQGPYCPSLIIQLKAKEHLYTKILFFTYLYYPTLYGLPDFSSKSILIPFSHDEDPFYFKQVENIFKNCQSILASTPAEKKFIESIYGESNKISIGGIGIDDSDILKEGPKCPKIAKDLSKTKYLLYLGRINKGKGILKLLEDFEQYTKLNSQEDIYLFFAGPMELDDDLFRSRERVRYFGVVEEKVKIELLKYSFALVNPSRYDSLSLVVLESLLAKKPVLINSQNPVLLDYSKQLPSVLGYKDYSEFKNQVDFLNSVNWKNEQNSFTEYGKNWALKTFSWDRVVNEFERIV